MTIGKKIAAACAILVLLTVVLGVVALLNAASLAEKNHLLVSRSLPGVYSSSLMRAQQKDLRIAMVTHIASNDQKEMAALESQIAEVDAALRESLKQYERAITSPKERELWSQIAPALDAVWTAWERPKALSRRGREREAIKTFRKEEEPKFVALRAATDDLLEWNRASGEQNAAASAQAATVARLWIWSILIAAAVAGTGLAFLLIRSTSGILKDAVAHLGEGADQVASAAIQIASTAQAMAQGTSEQAASLEETSASAEQMSSMTQRNAENSKQSAQLVALVDQNVGEVNSTLDEMVASMKEIGASSDKISKIIKVIDEIAFQTNILALNAAVEAARAGEAGMGFAVVADEVRSLAQRSAQAAKDTAVLIEESIMRSGEGSAKLDRVAQAIRSITASATKVRTLVDEVNLGSQEQAGGVNQISKAIAEMQQVTQRTAAQAEESAAASEELSSQAESMKQVVNRLRGLVVANG